MTSIPQQQPGIPAIVALATAFRQLAAVLPLDHNLRAKGHKQAACPLCRFASDAHLYAILAARPEAHNPHLLRFEVAALDALVAFAVAQPAPSSDLLQAIGQATIARAQAAAVLHQDTPHALIGATITGVRLMHAHELQMLYWPAARWTIPPVIELDTGLRLFPATDHALNAPGVVKGFDAHGDVVDVASLPFDAANRSQR